MPTTTTQHTPGSFSKARVIEGGVLVPTSGVVQSANLLSIPMGTRQLTHSHGGGPT